jgi:hypothetical protein
MGWGEQPRVRVVSGYEIYVLAGKLLFSAGLKANWVVILQEVLHMMIGTSPAMKVSLACCSCCLFIFALVHCYN